MSNSLPGDGEPAFNERIETRIVAGFIWALAGWTILVHLGVAVGLTFNQVFYLNAIALPIAAVGWFFCTRPNPLDKENAPETQTQLIPHPHIWAMGGLIALTTLFASYFVFRWVAMLYVIAAWGWTTFSHPTDIPLKSGLTIVSPRNRRSDLFRLALLCLCGILFVVTLHRPSIDDGFYISVAADAHRHPDRELWSTDTVHDDPKLPVILPIYKIESNEYLAAVIARVLHVSSVRAAHTVMPIAFAIFVVLAWAQLAFTISPRFWLAATAIAVGISLFDGSAEASPGNFAFMKLQEGKGVLASAIVPVICVYAFRFVTMGRWQDALMLVAAQVAGVGLSSSGILIGPAVACEIGLLCAPINRKSIWRILGVGITCLYPFILALLLRRQMVAITWVSQYELQTPERVLNRLFGSTQKYLYFSALIGAWLVIPRATARLMLAPAIMLLTVMINPALASFLQYKVFSPLTYWRGFWVVPWLVFAGIFICGIWENLCNLARRFRVSYGRTLAVIACLILVFGTLQFHPVFRHKKNGTTIHFGGLDVEEPEYAVAQRLVQLTPEKTSALAPEEVACWTAVQDTRPPLIFVRPFYTQSTDDVAGRVDVESRNELGEIAGKKHLSDDDIARLKSGLTHYPLGAVVLRKNAGPGVADMLQKTGFKHESSGEYVIWSRG